MVLYKNFNLSCKKLVLAKYLEEFLFLVRLMKSCITRVNPICIDQSKFTIFW